jgi:hypothetical protein
VSRISTIAEAAASLFSEENRPSRFHTRFVLVEGLDSWRALVQTLEARCDSVVRLSEYCEAADQLPRMGKVLDAIRERLRLVDRALLVLPLAEALRFDRNSAWVLRQLAEFSVHDCYAKRVIVPLFCAGEMFRREVATTERYRVGLLSAAPQVGGQELVQVVLSVPPVSLVGSENRVVNGVREYLRLWESGGHQSINLVSRFATQAEEQVGSFSVAVKRSAFMVLQSQLSELAQSRERWGEPRQWEWVLEHSQSASNISEVADKLLGVSRPQLVDWKQLSLDERWLMWVWLKCSAPDGEYLHAALGASESVSDFEQAIVTAAFDVAMNVDMARERSTLLNQLGVDSLSAAFWTQLGRLDDPLERLKVLPGVGPTDRRETGYAVRDLLNQGVPMQVWEGYLAISYPRLWDYLRPSLLPDTEIESYTNTYKIAKMRDCLTDELATAAAETAADGKMFWSLKTRKHVLDEVGEAQVFWMDGMGLEWVSVISGYLKAKAPNVKVVRHIARANLPTTTDANKEQISDRDYFNHELDKIAHSYDYSFPESLFRQIQCICEVIDAALERLQTEKRVVITSDHGTSRFALYGAKYEVGEGVVPRKNGRYGEVVNDCSLILSDVPLLKEDSYLVLRGYGRFPCGGSTVGETHGGAAIEEAIVPVLVLEKADGSSKVDFTLLQDVVRLGKDGVAYVELVVSGQLTSLQAEIGDCSLMAQMTGARNWRLKLSGLEAGHHEARIYGDGVDLGTVKFQLLASGIRVNRFEL